MTVDMNSVEASPTLWLVRVPQVFAEFEAEILLDLGASLLRKTGRDYWLIRIADPKRIHDSPAAKFLRWNLPVHHMWPCRPRETEGFIEKAAQAMWRKFGEARPQTLMAGPMDPGSPNRWFKTLASNLRGRALQLFPPECSMVRDAETQDARRQTLFMLVGEEGLFCGMQSPLSSNGFHPGGTRHIRQTAPGAISRAGAKIAEALHHLALHHACPAAGAHWLELGASPGGMTAELLARGYRVTAVDRAPLDKRLAHADGLREICRDVADFTPDAHTPYDALLCDMNGDARSSFAQVIRLASRLRENGIVVFTLKLTEAGIYPAINSLVEEVENLAAAAGLRQLSLTHLTYNRHEFTLICMSHRADRQE
jgi:23S rRNA (cytidine2498-2'-O)-methyltransferase